MNKKIMFLDDEIFLKDNNPAIQAADLLEENGYLVERTDKMSNVINSFYKDYYDLYILDIDMGKVEDDMIDENGTTVGRILRQLSTRSKIIIFSARGDVNHWFISANYHFDGYVYKSENQENESGINALLNMVNKVIDIKDDVISFEHKERDKLIYYYYTENNYIREEELIDFIDNMEYSVKKFEYVSDISDALKDKKDTPETVLVIGNEFDNDEDVKFAFSELFSFQNTPQVVLALSADDRDRDLIIHLINQKPFRLFNLKSNIKENLEEAIKLASIWYGKNEIFELPDDNEIIRFPLSDEDIAEITKNNDCCYEEEDE